MRVRFRVTAANILLATSYAQQNGLVDPARCPIALALQRRLGARYCSVHPDDGLAYVDGRPWALSEAAIDFAYLFDLEDAERPVKPATFVVWE